MVSRWWFVKPSRLKQLEWSSVRIQSFCVRWESTALAFLLRSCVVIHMVYSRSSVEAGRGQWSMPNWVKNITIFAFMGQTSQVLHNGSVRNYQCTVANLHWWYTTRYAGPVRCSKLGPMIWGIFAVQIYLQISLSCCNEHVHRSQSIVTCLHMLYTVWCVATDRRELKRSNLGLIMI